MKRLILFTLCPGLFAASKAEFEPFLIESQMVAMRDSVRLATDIYRPGKDGKPVDGKFPVIVYRTPYNKTGLKAMGAYLASRGYAMVAQDVRGRFKSEGNFYAFINEGPDGHDTIEWAAAQPWSNGKVGTAGASYLAWDQYLAAMERPPHLVAMYADVGGNTFYDEFAWPGGAPNPAWGMWILNSALSSPQAAADPAARAPLLEVQKSAMTWLAKPPAERAELFAKFPAHRKMFEDFYRQPAFNDYWKQRGLYTAAGWNRIKDVPIFFVSGWYDYFSEGLLENFAALSKKQKTPKRLWMGPWPHGVGRAECGNAHFGNAAAIDMREVLLDWFDLWMKSDKTEVLGDDRVRFYRMGGGPGGRDEKGLLRHGGEWVKTTSWPPPEVKPAKYYLHAQNGLTTARPGQETASHFEFDPNDPVPTAGGRYNMVPGIKACAHDQSPLDSRTDILRFQTEVLRQAVEVTGRVSARLWVSSDAPDTDFTAKLVDVHPDGYALNIADGVLRMRNRNGREKPELMKPGQTYQATIDLGTVSNLFAPGHRIRVEISSSNYPRIEPNPNTGEDAWSATKRVKAKNTVHHDAGRPSHVELPVRP
jgi:putative CocE/NonD family hydrolase